MHGAVRLTDEGAGSFMRKVAPLLGALTDAVDGPLPAAATRCCAGRLRVNADSVLRERRARATASGLPRYAPRARARRPWWREPRGRTLISEGFERRTSLRRPPRPRASSFAGSCRRASSTCAAPSYVARQGPAAGIRRDFLTDGHACILFLGIRRPSSPSSGSFTRAKKRIKNLRVQGQLLLNDGATAHRRLRRRTGPSRSSWKSGVRHLLRDGSLVELFPRWQDELFPLHVLYPSRFSSVGQGARLHRLRHVDREGTARSDSTPSSLRGDGQAASGSVLTARSSIQTSSGAFMS